MKKELLLLNPKMLQGLHNLYNFDFEKPCTIQKHSGSFTINSIKKALDLDSLKDTATVILFKNPRFEEFFTVQALENSFNLSERDYACKLSNFYNKGHFEEMRKDKEKIYYIVSQATENKAVRRPSSNDEYTRYKLGYVTGWSNGRGLHGISAFDIIDTAHKNKKTYLRTTKPSLSTDIHYFIDKSGYLVENKKINLMYRAEKLRADRKKAEVKAVNFDEVIQTTTSKINNFKMLICEKIQAAESFNDFCICDNLTSNIKYICLDFDYFKKFYYEKSLSSIEEANNRIASINNRIATLEEKIKAVQ